MVRRWNDAHRPSLPTAQHQRTTSAPPRPANVSAPAHCPQADMQEVNNSLPYDAEQLPDIAETLKARPTLTLTLTLAPSLAPILTLAL